MVTRLRLRMVPGQLVKGLRHMLDLLPDRIVGLEGKDHLPQVLRNLGRGYGNYACR